VIIVGTSMVVYPAAGLIHEAKWEAEKYLVDPAPARGLHGIHVIAEKAKDGVPQLVEHLIAQCR
jgi:NAD-dependent deacetylase